MTEAAPGEAAASLRGLLSATAAAVALESPARHTQLLRLIVQTAAQVMAAESAVLLLLDAEGDELVFDVTLGLEDERVDDNRIPVGQGIAGLVAASGQPLAVSNASEDARVAPEITQSLAYTPQSILCVPLLYNDRVIGVLEVLERSPGRTFTSRDIETLSLFAKQAAIAIAQSRSRRSLPTLVDEMLSAAGIPLERQDAVRSATRVEQDPVFRKSRGLMELLQEIAEHGEAELDACEAILKGFAEYLRTRPRPRGDV